MAQSVTKITNLKSNIQSKAQEAVTSLQQKTASSTKATQAWSTTTPTISETPKVASLRKAQPSVTPVQNITPVQPTNLLWTTNLRKAAIPDLLNKQTEEKDVKNITIPTNMIRYASRDWWEAGNAVKETLFQQWLDWFNDKISSAKDFREKATQTVWEYWVDLFNYMKWEAKYMWNFYSSVANNLVQWLPRWISRAEYWIAELIDWWLDTEWTEKLKNQAEYNKNYWLNTDTYKKQQNITDVKSFFENPWMISSTFSEMLPMWLWPRFAVPYVLAQSYADTYTDYANDEELSQRLTDNQMHLLSLWVWSTVGLVEYAFDLIWWIIPWVKNLTKPWFETVKNTLKRPLFNIVKRMARWGLSEWIEEVIQDEIVDQVAWFFGSEREMPTWASRLTTFVISSIVWGVLWWWNAAVEIKNHQELKNDFDEWSKVVDEVAPWVSQKDKETLFSTIVAAQIQDANMDNKLVEKYESQVTQLYNQIEELNKELENTTDETRKAEITKQIDNANQQITKIDETINTVNKVTEEVNAKLQELSHQQEELPAEQQTQLPKEMAWENLSKQTMRIVPDSEVKVEWLEKQITSEQQYKEAEWQETPTQRYLKNRKKLSTKTIRYANTNWTNKEFKLKEDLIKELKYMTEDAWWELLSQYDEDSLRELIKVADRTLKSMKQWRNTRIKQDQLAKLYAQLNKGIDLRNAMIEENREIIKQWQLDERDVESLSDYMTVLWTTDYEAARNRFVKQNTLYWKHLVWLKNVNVKELEWKITDRVADRFSLILAKASQILWIDFNKVIWENEFNLTAWRKDSSVSWYFTREWTKEWLVDLLNEYKKEWKDTSWADDYKEHMFKSGIYLATLDKLSTNEAVATFIHEFVHLLDYSRIVDRWLQVHKNEHYRINETNKTWKTGYDTDYTLSWDKSWETFNNPEDINNKFQDYRDKYDDLMAWKIDPVQLTYSEIEYVNGMLYNYEPTEILARYAEQYYMRKEDKKLFDEYSKNPWYWSEEEFKKLITKFEKLLKDEFADYQIEEWNRNYVDVMQKLMDFKYNQTFISDKKWLEDIKNSNPDMQQDASVKMLEMQKDYVWISAELDKLEWTISEEIKAEYATELDNLATNMWILEETLQDYTRFVDKKVPIENFEAADNVLESENLEEDQQQIEDENASFEEQEQMQDEMDEQIEEAWWIQNIDEWKDREKEFTEEERTQKKWERKRNLVESRDSVWDVAKDILTPTMSRIYNINKRVAWRLTQMETQSWINIYRYTQRCQWFVDHMNTLKWTAKLEVTDALLNFWALASEQWENIDEYKRQEVAKLREVLLRHWFKEEDINNMFSVLNDLWNRYKESWLSISISDMYFPRVVKDYKWLIEYMSRVSWTKIEEKTKGDLMKDIQDIIDNDSYSDAEKERLIRNKLTTQFPRKIKVNSKHSEERKLWLLSEWWAGIYAYYEDPTVSLAHYITTMEYAIQRQLFLWWQAKDLWLDIDTINSSNEDSVSSIVEWLVDRWEISSSQVNELQKCIIAVMDKKNTPRWIQRIKDLTYTMALTNYISAINQIEDIWVAIVENKWWLISSVKAIFSKAWIKYTDSWLESAYEMFRTNLWISNKLFAASWFNFTDRLGKKCFLNAAWTSMVKRAKNGRSRKYLVERLTAMYWEKTTNHIMEKVDAWDYMTNWQIDIDVLTDLLYQLWTTQPIYASAMPVAYLRSPNARWFYALSMFSIRQADHIIQSTKQTYKERWAAAAAVQAFWFVATRMFFGVLVWDLWDWLMWKWTEETWLWQWIDEWPEAASDKFLEDYLKAFSKLWMLSDYDKETFKKDWIWWVIANKMYPYIIQEAHKLRKSIERAFKNEDATELIPMLRDVPIVWKQVASWWNYFLEEATTQARPSSKKTWRPKSSWSERPTSSSKSRPTS